MSSNKSRQLMRYVTPWLKAEYKAQKALKSVKQSLLTKSLGHCPSSVGGIIEPVLRLRRISSDDTGLFNRATKIKEYFRERGHLDEKVSTKRSTLLASTLRARAFRACVRVQFFCMTWARSFHLVMKGYGRNVKFKSNYLTLLSLVFYLPS